jgi:hypothetical protein
LTSRDFGKETLNTAFPFKPSTNQVQQRSGDLHDPYKTVKDFFADGKNIDTSLLRITSVI